MNKIINYLFKFFGYVITKKTTEVQKSFLDDIHSYIFSEIIQESKDKVDNSKKEKTDKKKETKLS